MPNMLIKANNTCIISSPCKPFLIESAIRSTDEIKKQINPYWDISVFMLTRIAPTIPNAAPRYSVIKSILFIFYSIYPIIIADKWSTVNIYLIKYGIKSYKGDKCHKNTPYAENSVVISESCSKIHSADMCTFVSGR